MRACTPARRCARSPRRARTSGGWRRLAEFVSLLALDAASSRDHELLDLLPTHRSQITYRHDDTGYVIHPDASFQLGYKGEWTWYLLEYERRATTPKRLPERLASYRRYWRARP